VQKLREEYLFDVIDALISIHQKAGEHDRVLNISRMVVDTKYNIHQVALNLSQFLINCNF
jgi:hypothetical protein